MNRVVSSHMLEIIRATVSYTFLIAGTVGAGTISTVMFLTDDPVMMAPPPAPPQGSGDSNELDMYMREQTEAVRAVQREANTTTLGTIGLIVSAMIGVGGLADRILKHRSEEKARNEKIKITLDQHDMERERDRLEHERTRQAEEQEHEIRRLTLQLKTDQLACDLIAVKKNFNQLYALTLEITKHIEIDPAITQLIDKMEPYNGELDTDECEITPRQRTQGNSDQTD